METIFVLQSEEVWLSKWQNAIRDAPMARRAGVERISPWILKEVKGNSFNSLNSEG